MRLVRALTVAFFLCVASAAAAAETVTMAREVPYSADADVQRKVREECVKLQGQLADYTQEFGRAIGVDVKLTDDVVPDAPGRVLQVEITEAISAGNPFIGHRKHTEVRGELFEDGQRIASFKGLRTSMGGAFGGYKGSCSVLGRTVKALGKDIATWLANPQDGAELGDL
jgi:hypothetical protein